MAGSALRWWAAGVVLAVAVIVGSMCWEVVSLRLLHSPDDVTSHRFFATHHALNHTFQLSNGESVRMPYQVYDGRQLLLVARTRLDVARSFLAELELHPWQIDEHHALALTGIIDYIDCVAGPYGEWFLSFFATRSAGKSARESVVWGRIEALTHRTPTNDRRGWQSLVRTAIAIGVHASWQWSRGADYGSCFGIARGLCGGVSHGGRFRTIALRWSRHLGLYECAMSVD